MITTAYAVISTRPLLPCHYDVIKWNYFPRYCLFARGSHQWPMESLSWRDRKRWPLIFLCCQSEQTIEQTLDCRQVLRDTITVIWRRHDLVNIRASNSLLCSRNAMINDENKCINHMYLDIRNTLIYELFPQDIQWMLNEKHLLQMV